MIDYRHHFRSSLSHFRSAQALQQHVESLKSELTDLESEGCKIRFRIVEENFADEAKLKEEEVDADVNRLRQELEKVFFFGTVSLI